MTHSEPVVPCPGCKEGWRPVDAKFCSTCFEGQIEYLKGVIENLTEELRRNASYSVTSKPLGGE